MPFVIKCPGCKQKIKWLVDDPPDDCPACGYRLRSDRADDDVVVPNILAFSTRCQDGVYKAMEKASEQRMYQAAEMAGCDASDMRDLKITNLRDNMKQGEIAAIPVVNDVTRQMDAIKAANPNAQMGFGGGIGYSESVPTGPYPSAGARTQQAFRRAHADRMSGQLVRGDVMSDLPANEITRNPNYRPRV
jgi:hypothetical protein